MTEKEFDQDDAETLTEFCDFEKRTYENQSGVDYFKDGEFICYERNWKPWDKRSPQLQIQSLKDAVREKGLVKQFQLNLDKILDIGHKELHRYDVDFSFTSAPPKAICRAILDLEGE